MVYVRWRILYDDAQLIPYCVGSELPLFTHLPRRDLLGNPYRKPGPAEEEVCTKTHRGGRVMVFCFLVRVLVRGISLITVAAGNSKRVYRKRSFLIHVIRLCDY